MRILEWITTGMFIRGGDLVRIFLGLVVIFQELVGILINVVLLKDRVDWKGRCVPLFLFLFLHRCASFGT